MNGRTIAIAIPLIAMCTRSLSQELGIECNGGLQGTQYPLQNGTVAQLPAGSLGLSYTFHLGSRWGLVTGLTGAIYRTRASLRDSAFTYDEVDDAGSAFEYRVRGTGYQEIQQFIAASVPILFQYHTIGSGMQWYADAGVRAVFPLNESIRQSAQQLSLSGYYPDYSLEVTDLPQHGFGAISNWKASQTLPLKPAALLSASTGVSFRFSHNARLYAGLYIDYGLTTLKSGRDSMPLVTYSPQGLSHVQANSVLKMPVAGNMSVLSFGLQVRLSFGTAKPKSVAPRKPKQAPIEASGASITDAEAQIVQAPVLFGALGETSISDIQQAHLDKVAMILLRYPGVRIGVIGHICNSGTATENAKVGEARARAVARYLESKGIDHGRMEVSYLQQSDPVLPNNPAANYRNRRVVITIR